MALSTAEIQRIRVELGYNALSVGADPYIGYTSIFESIIAVYLTAGASTTSATKVAEATERTLTTIVVASATGISAGSLLWVGVDDSLECATVQSISSTSVSLSLKNAHTGTYPVTVDGGEAMVREVLAQIRVVKSEVKQTFGEGALKKADELEWYDTGKALIDSTAKALMFWRDELASLLGVPNMWRVKQSAGSTIALY